MLGVIDILVIITVVLSVLFALYRGLVRELLGIAAWILAGFAALYSYGWVQPIMGKMIDNQTIAGVVGSLIVALVVLILMTLMNSFIASRLRESALSGLDRILGLVFGVFRAALLIAVIYIGASMVLSEKQLAEMEDENRSIPYIHVMAGWLEQIVPENIKDDMKAYEQGKLQSEKIQKIGIDLQKKVVDELVEYQESDKQSLDDMIELIAAEEEP